MEALSWPVSEEQKDGTCTHVAITQGRLGDVSERYRGFHIPYPFNQTHRQLPLALGSLPSFSWPSVLRMESTPTASTSSLPT